MVSRDKLEGLEDDANETAKADKDPSPPGGDEGDGLCLPHCTGHLRWAAELSSSPPLGRRDREWPLTFSPGTGKIEGKGDEEMLALDPMAAEELPLAYESMGREFPDEERKPLSMLQTQYAKGLLDLWWLKEDGVRRGYAMLLKANGEAMVLLDYLAMLDKGQGYGSACLALLQQRYPRGLLVEAEAEEPGLPPEEQTQRARRLRFYRMGDFHPCGWQAEVFGVVYQIFGWFETMPPDWDSRCKEAYGRLYAAQLPPRWLEAHFHIKEEGT